MTKSVLTTLGAVLAIAILSIACIAAEAPKSDAPLQATMKIDGMTCGGCVGQVKSALSKLEGVESCDVNLKEARATVVYDGTKIDDAKLVAAVSQAGFKAQIGELRSAGAGQDAKAMMGKGCGSGKKSCSKTCSPAEKSKCFQTKKGDI